MAAMSPRRGRARLYPHGMSTVKQSRKWKIALPAQSERGIPIQQEVSMKEQMWKSECTKASCRHVEYYRRNPGHQRCPKCGALMIPKRG